MIAAYSGRCALSGLPEPLLLDAAHIIADKDEQLGQPVVPNGLPLSKPLLILLTLGRLARGEAPMVQFSDIDGALMRLLAEFGPSSAARSRHYPFWHLRTDGLWQLSGPQAILDRPPGATPTLTELRRGKVSGGLTTALVDAFRRNPELIATVARRIVEAHFPESLQQDILDAVGLPPSDNALSGRSADAAAIAARRDSFVPRAGTTGLRVSLLRMQL